MQKFPRSRLGPRQVERRAPVLRTTRKRTTCMSRLAGNECRCAESYRTSRGRITSGPGRGGGRRGRDNSIERPLYLVPAEQQVKLPFRIVVPEGSHPPMRFVRVALNREEKRRGAVGARRSEVGPGSAQRVDD